MSLPIRAHWPGLRTCSSLASREYEKLRGEHGDLVSITVSFTPIKQKKLFK